MDKNLSLVIAPASEPISTAEAKTHIRVEHSADDTLIGNIITISRQAAELYTGRAFITQTWNMFLDHWPLEHKTPWWNGVRDLPVDYYTSNTSIEMPLAPLQSITHIKTYDDADSATTFASSNYFVSAYSGMDAKKGRITLRDGSTWPTYTRNADGIEIQFVAGYGSSSTDVPMQIRQAILEEIAFRYENRGDNNKDQSSGILGCQMAQELLSMFRVVQL